MQEWDRYRWFGAACRAGFRLEKLVELSGVSLRQLERQLRAQWGRSPEEWLNEQRIVAAPHLLRMRPSIKVVAIELGYHDSAHFCRHFKSIHGMTPSEFVEKFCSR